MEDGIKLEHQAADFAPEIWEGWAYTNTPRPPAYAEGVSYVADISDIGEFERRNASEGSRNRLSESGNSVTYDGIYVGVIARAVGDESAKFERLKFSPPVPMDEVASGDQPPITGRYPYVTFPAEGKHQYALMIQVDANEAAPHKFGTTFESFTIRATDRARRESLPIPEDCPCDREVRSAIADFHRNGAIPQGEYKVNLEVERVPAVMIRIDGGRPLCSILVREGLLKSELPLTALFSRNLSDILMTGEEPSTERSSPMISTAGAAKYAEMPMGIGVSEDGLKWVAISQAVLRTGGDKEETGQLVYSSLRRSESVEGVAQNPNLGLVEIQVVRMATIKSINIEFKPERIPSSHPRAVADEFRFGGLDDYTMKGGGPMRGGGGYFSAPSVNVGRTELAQPKVGPASPTMRAEWDGHVRTIRLCLTNDIN